MHPVLQNAENEKKTTHENETSTFLEDIKTVKEEMLRITDLIYVGMTKTSAKKLARNLQKLQDVSDFGKLLLFFF